MIMQNLKIEDGCSCRIVKVRPLFCREMIEAGHALEDVAEAASSSGVPIREVRSVQPIWWGKESLKLGETPL